MWTGVVVTSRVTHATPACMMAHVKDRGMEDEIAVQMAFAGIEVILGGGWDKFLPARKLKVDFDGAGSSPEGPPLAAGAAPTSRAFLASAAELAAGAAAGGTTTLIEAPRPLVGADGKPYGNRTDGRDLIAAMERQGYTFARSPAELSLVTGGAPRKVLGLFHSGPMPRVSEGRSPSLSAMALAALRVLSQSPQGFFLMIEGSQIDWGAHANDFNYAVLEAADFDDTLEAVRGFLEAKGIAGETLIVLTADHETGGLTLNKHPQLPLGLEPKWTTTYHTGAPVPVFSCGAGAASFGGFQNHAAIGRKLIQCLLGRKVEFPEPAAAPPAKERL